ncbi:hypothetical protein B0I35DRAFT_140604 [Stachybotrys elegans]|uniref:Uncharacterized protein n=1 Tax=Stachybotrys elegans TaxID=80388 RepID=A0A8K0T1C8_9HYPO|nr:hypothetical protein B0I35DRAFT_140604 [Stachybotrys elegans]
MCVFFRFRRLCGCLTGEWSFTPCDRVQPDIDLSSLDFPAKCAAKRKNAGTRYDSGKCDECVRRGGWRAYIRKISEERRRLKQEKQKFDDDRKKRRRRRKKKKGEGRERSVRREGEANETRNDGEASHNTVSRINNSASIYSISSSSSSTSSDESTTPEPAEPRSQGSVSPPTRNLRGPLLIDFCEPPSSHLGDSNGATPTEYRMSPPRDDSYEILPTHSDNPSVSDSQETPPIQRLTYPPRASSETSSTPNSETSPSGESHETLGEANGTSSEAEEARSEAQETNDEVSESDSEVSESDSEASESDSEISESDSEISESDSEISETDSEVSESDSEISESDSEVSESGSEVSESGSEVSESNSEVPESDNEAPSSNAEASGSDNNNSSSDGGVPIHSNETLDSYDDDLGGEDQESISHDTDSASSSESRHTTPVLTLHGDPMFWEISDEASESSREPEYTPPGSSNEAFESSSEPEYTPPESSNEGLESSSEPEYTPTESSNEASESSINSWRTALERIGVGNTVNES